MCRWLARAGIPMLNRKQIRGGESPGVLRLPRPALSQLRRLSLSATFFSGFLGQSANQHLHHLLLRPAASAEQQDEPSVRIATRVRIGSLADDRPTPPFL